MTVRAWYVDREVVGRAPEINVFDLLDAGTNLCVAPDIDLSNFGRWGGGKEGP